MNLTYELIGHSSDDNVILLDGESINTIFTGGIVPKDKDYNSLNIGLFIFYTILAAIGIVYAGVWFVFELIFRKTKYVESGEYKLYKHNLDFSRIVKMSSPYLNLVICAGAMMLYCEVILQGIDKSYLDTCMVNN